ncbi:MAG: hypothetical protein HYT87_06435 [Nitrospirae bacterium]|nr:hypothetical protein [Nitrospirota bacterium]
MEILELDGRSWLREFFQIQLEVYRNDANFVAPLRVERKHFFNPEKNPFFKHAECSYIVAREGNRPLGCLIAFIDRAFANFHKEDTAHFGFFETTNDPKVSGALIGAALDFAKRKGMKTLRGPFNFSTNHECGLLVDGFGSTPMILMTYNPAYYVKLLEAEGLTKAMDLLAYRLDAKPLPPALRSGDGEVNRHGTLAPPEPLKAVAQSVGQKQGVRVRNMRKREFDTIVDFFGEVYNDAWSKNWGFVPMDREEFRFVAWGLKYFLDEDLCYWLELDGKPIGLSITIPDYNVPLRPMQGKILPFGLLKFLAARKRINSARVFALGVRKEFHDQAFASLLYLKTWEEVLKRGYEWVEMSWILESNPRMRRAIEMAGGKVYKTYRVFERKV